MKKMALFFLVVFLTSCTAINADEQIIKMAKEFKELQYNIKDYTKINNLTEYQQNLLDKLKPFLSEEEYEDFSANRLAGISAYAATQYRSNINVEKITFVKKQENKEKGTIGYDYTMTFKLAGKVNKTITKKGKMVLIKTENGWKIKYDWNQQLMPKDFE